LDLDITNSILNHILGNFGITSKKRTSIKDPLYDLSISLILADDDGKEQNIKSYGAQVFVEGERFRAIYFELSSNEHALIAKLDDCPAYACYLATDEVTGDPYDGILAISNDDVKWIGCDVVMQANFLAGMERLNYIFQGWQPLSERKDLIEMFRSYVDYVDSKIDLSGTKDSAA
jgi:hypothetical protein